jgi:hypothetical protein
MDDASAADRFARFRRLPATLLRSVRRALGWTLQVFFQDQIRALGRQTERLGTSSVESATYLGLELQVLDSRLSRIEEDVAELRAMLESERPRT